MTEEKSRPRWVVLKFGGTSVSSRTNWGIIANIVRQRLDDGLLPLIVCSAFSGVSNTLEELLELALDDAHTEPLEELAAKHRAMAEDLDLAPALVDDAIRVLERVLLGISLVAEASPRVRAKVMAQGELMSTRLGAAFLNAQGLSVRWTDARTILRSSARSDDTDERRYLSVPCHHGADRPLADSLGAQGPILTQGFIARNSRDETVLLGRGGSDTSAAYMSCIVEAERCEIWTDVAGMFTANPHQVPAARLLRALGYDEAQEIATTGAKVLHPPCIAPLREASIPLHIRSTPQPDLRGTVISLATAEQAAQVKAISVKNNVTLVSMDTLGMWQEVGFLADSFQVFKKHGLSIDLVSTSETNVTVSLDPSANALEPLTLDALVVDLGKRCRARIVSHCAAISLVGRHIRRTLHELGPILGVFEEQRVHLMSQAASDLNLTFVVEQAQAQRLVRELHWLLFESGGRGDLLGPSWLSLGQPKSEDEEERPQRWGEAQREALIRLAQTQSPAYVYDLRSIAAAATGLLEMKSLDRVLYAVKANANAGVLTTLHRLGVGFECVSPGELDLVFGLFPELPVERVLFTPNFAHRQEYEQAFERGVPVTVDNLYVLEAWPEVFRGRSIFVRIDPGKGRGHHSHVRTAGKQSKFGVAPEEVVRLSELVRESGGPKVVGLHAHAGSGILNADQWAEVALFLAEVATLFPAVRVLDLGGGIGIPYKPSQVALDLVEVDHQLERFREANPKFELWMEPGRYLVAEAGVLLAKVTQTKVKGEVEYVGIDAGMNSLIRPALYGAYHEIVNLSRLDAPRDQIANIVGPICETGDTLGYGRSLARAREGDVICIATAGAYGRVMSSSYNSRSPAVEVVLEEAER